ncbi:glycopeptide, partial [Dentipellis sp. KUC8613]
MAPTVFQILSAFVLAAAAVASVKAESHTIKFDNRYIYTSPTLIVNGANQTLANNQWTVTGSSASGIAYLQTGECLYNGEHCTLLETTLGNSHCEGCGSSTDISLIPPYVLTCASSCVFLRSYYNGCDGEGATCDTPDCSTAFFKSDDNQVQVACQSDDVNLLITFC